jgi:hypothetical protein
MHISHRKLALLITLNGLGASLTIAMIMRLL